MRLFIAINIPQRSIQLINRKVNIIKKDVKQDLKWVKPENWHITLKFLGDVTRHQIKPVQNTLLQLPSVFNKFSLNFNEIGAFPNLNFPKVFFINVGNGSKKVRKIYNRIEKYLTDKGFTPTKNNYRPHLTIARSSRNTDLKQFARVLSKFDDKHFINIHMWADRISLMKSELLPAGPEYEEIFGISL